MFLFFFSPVLHVVDDVRAAQESNSKTITKQFFLAPSLHTNTLLPKACRGTERQLGIVPVPEDRGQLSLKQRVVVAMCTVGACVSEREKERRRRDTKRGSGDTEAEALSRKEKEQRGDKEQSRLHSELLSFFLCLL